MKSERDIVMWLIALACMLLTACSSSDSAEELQTNGNSPAITIYVYSPENPTLTRSDVGNINALSDESKVTCLQIWIFDYLTGATVGHLTTSETTALNASQGVAYQIPVDDDFARNKPSVDVFVLANVTDASCGCHFDENSTRANLLDNAKISGTFFSLSSKTTTVPFDGLPMVGVLRNQSVIGDAPVLRIGTERQIATVQLTRAVSKVRFVFANTTGASMSIKGITMGAEMIPTEEYLIPQSKTPTSYNTLAVSLLTQPISEVACVDDPTAYIYGGQTAQEYETLMNNSGLTIVGPYYLRESDKRLAGQITYKIGSNDEAVANYQMERAGDFLRNHSWIVYAYHAGGTTLQMGNIFVKEWTTKSLDHEVYNW